MCVAENYLEDALFLEYWGESPERSDILGVWLSKVDSFVQDWTPSEELFLEEQGKSDGMKKISVASMFSGCGGMDLGLQGGFDFLDRQQMLACVWG